MEMLKNEIYLMLMSMRKVDIDFYRKILNCDVRSNLNKSDMAAAVALCIEHDSDKWLRRVPTWELAMIKELLKCKPGKWYDGGFQPLPSTLETLRLVEVEVTEERHVRYRVSERMHRALSGGIDAAIEYSHSRNYNHFEQYAFGMLNLYGLVPREKMIHMLIRAAKTIAQQMDDESAQIINACVFSSESFLLNFYCMMVGEQEYFYHSAVQSDYELYRKMASRKEFDYKNFSDTEIRHAGEGIPYIRTAQETTYGQALLKELKKLNISGDVLNIIYRDFYTIAQENPKELTELLAALANDRLTSMAQLQGLLSMVMEFSNNIPRWELKGYSSYEIHEKYEKPKLKPLPSQPFNPMNLVPTNIGRNDPCPCGSGKKYKNCHGKLS